MCLQFGNFLRYSTSCVLPPKWCLAHQQTRWGFGQRRRFSREALLKGSVSTSEGKCGFDLEPALEADPEHPYHWRLKGMNAFRHTSRDRSLT
jgi:hypothetical protein